MLIIDGLFLEDKQKHNVSCPEKINGWKYWDGHEWKSTLKSEELLATCNGNFFGGAGREEPWWMGCVP